MLSEYTLRMPRVVYSGKHAIWQMKTLIEGKYKKVALFTDKGVANSGILEEPLKILRDCKVEVIVMDELVSEPTCDEAQKVIDAFKVLHSDCIVAIGGGSVMDIAKLASIAATDEFGVRDLLKHPSMGRKMIDTIMIPTTAGTGSEATANSIVSVPEKELKIGIVNPEMIADAVILDGEMLRKLPAKIAAATGVDALAHAIECYTSNKANPFSNLFASEALKLIFANINAACKDSEAIEAKTNMLIAAFYAGVAITASGTTAVHALAYPLGGKYHIAHGISNALMLMPVMRFNREVCLEEFAQLYDLLGSSGATSKEEKSEWVLGRMEKIIRELEIPTSLRDLGIGLEDLDFLVSAGMDVKRLLVNNKKQLTPEDARRLYLEVM